MHKIMRHLFCKFGWHWWGPWWNEGICSSHPEDFPMMRFCKWCAQQEEYTGGSNNA